MSAVRENAEFHEEALARATRELARPRFATAAEVFAARPAPPREVRFAGLWVAGSLAGLARKAVAVVGSRAPSDGGRTRAHALAEALGRAGVTVVSGLALGIDGSAHAGALAGGGDTLGVLGGGHGHFFPSRHRGLALRMLAAGGAVLSPYPPEEPARPWQFLQRNGVVAALVDAVVVVEAAARSGALNTATWAGNLGIDVLAFPGDVDRPKAAGCNALIRDGATLVRGPADVLEALDIESEAGDGSEPPAMPRDRSGLSALERTILDALARGPHSIESLLALGPAPVGEVSAALVTLEIGGSIRRAADSATYRLA
jgi:DNA processing protein